MVTPYFLTTKQIYLQVYKGIYEGEKKTVMEPSPKVDFDDVGVFSWSLCGGGQR